MMDPIRVLYLDHTAKWSGGEIALFRTLSALDRSQVEPLVLLAEEGPFADRLREANIPVHVLPLSEKVREVRKDTLGAGAVVRQAGAALSLLTYAQKVAHFARAHQAQVLHCNSLKSDFYGVLAGKLARLPVLWHIRDHIDPGYLPGPAVKLVRTLANRMPAFVVTNSNSTTEKLFPGKTPDPNRVRAVYDGLMDSELTTPKPAPRTAWKNDPPHIGMVGRFVEWKGQHVLLDAATKLTAQGIEAQYIFIGAPLFGEADYEATLKQKAEPLGERVVFTGFRSDVPDLLRSLDILVHASITPEPFGQVVIEGMAEGIPVIAANAGGVREIAASGDEAVLTPPGNADALADALQKLLADPERASRLAQTGWKTVREKFTAAQSARGLEAVYHVLIPSASSPKTQKAASAP